MRVIVSLVLCATLVSVAVSPMFSEAIGVEQSGSGNAGVTEESDDAVDEVEEPVEPPPPASIDITEYPRSMKVGEEATISYDLTNADRGAKVKWRSSDDNIATVSSDGSVRAFAAGKIEITATLGSARTSILISVEENVILPESFSVNVEEFTEANMLLSEHDLNIGDELHIGVRINPDDARISGKFEWDVSGNGVVRIETVGNIDENAVITAEAAGKATLTVRYADDPEEESERVDLGDYKLVFNVIEEDEPMNFSLIAALIIVSAAAAIILILIAVNRGRRRAEYERRARIARKRQDEMRRGRTDDERERLIMEGYERGYRDSEADQSGRMTKVYDFPVAPPPPDYDVPGRPLDEPDEAEDAGGREGPGGSADGVDRMGNNGSNGGYGLDEAGESDEPEKPFSVDDIE
jgi:hypothetical protein